MSLSTRMYAAWRWLFLVALAAVINRRNRKRRRSGRPSQASLDWQQAADGFVQSYFAAQPFFAAQAGKHDYDGQLPDMSEHG